jgi:hypothetical protein
VQKKRRSIFGFDEMYRFAKAAGHDEALVCTFTDRHRLSARR